MSLPPPSPIDVPTSQQFDGNDGKWSSFIARVGTPEQSFRVLPASSTGEFLIPLPEGCIESAGDPPDCGNRRGVYGYRNFKSGFVVNESTTWKELGLYQVGLNSELGYEANASYGLDNVGLMAQNSGGPTLKSQVVGGIASQDFYLGVFGLSPKPANFSGFAYPQRSFMTTLKDENMIPSLSYGYTAGAFYKSPRVHGSLTLGGFDQTRFIPNNVTFPFDADDSRPLSLKIQRILASNTLSGTVSLLDDEIYVRIDTAVPYLWLPRSACDRFEQAFGLMYDNLTDVYRINDKSHTELLAKNPAVTFSLGASLDPNQRVNIVLPYTSFYLQASYPIYPNETNFFPIRRAADDSQYVLGRSLLQEAYIVVDYERGNFSIHQAKFPQTTDPKRIVPITDPDRPVSLGDPKPPANDNSGLPTKAIIGIVVGIGILLLVVAILVTLFYRRRRQRKQRNMGDYTQKTSPQPIVPEVSGDDVPELHENEKERPQLGGEPIYEMQEPEGELEGPGTVVELGGAVHEADKLQEHRTCVQELPA